MKDREAEDTATFQSPQFESLSGQDRRALMRRLGMNPALHDFDVRSYDQLVAANS